ncbi:Acyl-CoA N-acyltransferase (NAT) superfamily protein [Forsythia ovata]|uniref:Acyl-CoA N-acyltransferase (NAT) superfamily protein n=1 Tax=Forsythia ovata TaxID=205694 RepID=A0ABD1T3K3_9LAMI
MDPSRITLRKFRPTDADDLFSWAGDDQVTRYLRWKTLESKQEALTFIEEVCMPHPWRRSICIDDCSVGFISVFSGSGEDRCRADIGYAVAVEFWGQGIASKAVEMAIPQVFQDFPELVRLQAYVDVENKASHRVLEKAGFSKEGLLRKYFYLKGRIKDLVVYSILSKDESI